MVLRFALSANLFLEAAFVVVLVWHSGVGYEAGAEAMKYRYVCLNIERQLFTVRVTGHWHGLPGDAVAAPSVKF